jgi:hypothetical protein
VTDHKVEEQNEEGQFNCPFFVLGLKSKSSK